MNTQARKLNMIENLILLRDEKLLTKKLSNMKSLTFEELKENIVDALELYLETQRQESKKTFNP